jgi:hypothetical protein
MIKKRLFHIVGISISTFFLLSACGNKSNTNGAAQSTPPPAASSDWAAPVITGKIESNEIKESSGLAFSKCQTNLLWTHNDQGSGPFIYAISPDGKPLATFRVPNAENVDWEDIDEYKDASGKCFVYIADTGDNDEVRPQVTVYRIPEPEVKPEYSSSSKENPIDTAPAEAVSFNYGEKKDNAEAMLVHPQTGDIYIVTKHNKVPAHVYKVKPQFGQPGIQTATKLGDVAMPAEPPGRITGGSISPDGKRVILCDVESGYELVLPAGEANFDAIWKQKPVVVDLGKRKQGESVTYNADGTAIFAGSEKKDSPIFVIRRQR